MNLLALFLRRISKQKRKPKRIVKRSNRNRSLSAGIPSVLTDVYKASQPGAKKMEFPFSKIPVIQTEVKFDKDTRDTLVVVSGIIGGSILGSAILRTVNK